MLDESHDAVKPKQMLRWKEKLHVLRWLHYNFGRTRLWQTLGHNVFSFNAMAIKLWENLQLSFGNNMVEFDLSRGKYF